MISLTQSDCDPLERRALLPGRDPTWCRFALLLMGTHRPPSLWSVLIWGGSAWLAAFGNGRREPDAGRCSDRRLRAPAALTPQCSMSQPVKERPASLPSVKTLHDKEALGTVPADRPLAAQDVSGLPASGGPVVPGKRSLPVPNKVGRPGAGALAVDAGDQVALNTRDLSFD